MLITMGLLCGAAHSQTLEQLRADLVAKQESSRRALRDAMVQLRNVRSRSCSAGQARDCELVALTDIEIALLDVETKYQRASSSAGSPESAERFAKAKAAADEARSKVSDLIDILK